MTRGWGDKVRGDKVRGGENERLRDMETRGHGDMGMGKVEIQNVSSDLGFNLKRIIFSDGSSLSRGDVRETEGQKKIYRS